MSVSIRFHKDNLYTIIPSIHHQLGDSVDFSIAWYHVGTDDLVHRCHVTISIVYLIGRHGNSNKSAYFPNRVGGVRLIPLIGVIFIIIIIITFVLY